MAFDRELAWIGSQGERATRLVEEWAAIPSGSTDREGLARMADAVATAFAPFGVPIRRGPVAPWETIAPNGEPQSVPLGDAVRLVKRPDASRRVLLVAHLDTVFDTTPVPRRRDATILEGAGVADCKGGIVVLLLALEAFERSAEASALGWEVLLNPDEEIGSPGSRPLLEEAARRNHVGLVFEPALPDGTLIDRRKGSGNFTIVVRGRAAHAGRDFAAGRNAVTAAARIATRLDAINGTIGGVTVNVGALRGGGKVNVVPDLAIVHFNVRHEKPEDAEIVRARIGEIVAGESTADGIACELHGGFGAPPKVWDEPTRSLFALVVECGRELGLDLRTRPSGGVCDGNRLAAFGLPNVDTMGARGEGIHGPDEIVHLPSLVERARLTALVLHRLATGGPPEGFQCS